jgi:hypothetical protein
MKKMIVPAMVICCTVFLLSSCASSPYKQRKKCRGNGGWYGNRNLSKLDIKHLEGKTMQVKPQQ